MRKLKTDVYTAAEKLIAFIQALQKQPALLAIDGRCGLGKTTLARALQEKSGAARGGGTNAIKLTIDQSSHQGAIHREER